MALDGITLYALKEELTDRLNGGRIDKIYQPEEDLFTLDVWNRGQTQLLICTGDFFRIHLSETDFENPSHPPPFCMLLRKHLEGGSIKDITQSGLDRLLYIKVSRREEQDKRLIVELMGRRCNVVLTEGEEILGALKVKTEKQRDLETGKRYRRPPPQDKIDPREITGEETNGLKGKEEPLWRSILHSIEGVGPLLSKEIATRSVIDPEEEEIDRGEAKKILKTAEKMGRRVEENDFDPVVYLGGAAPVEFAPFPLANLSEKETRNFEDISKALDFYFQRKEKISKKNRLRGLLSSKLEEEEERILSVMENLEEQLERAENREELKRNGDIIMANLSRIEKGQKEVELEDIYNQNEKKTIQLDPSLTPQKNAEDYYRRYKKLKRGRKKMKKKRRRLEKEKRFIEDLKEKLKESDQKEELEKIRGKLDEKGYFEEPPQKEEEGSGGPREFWVNGFKILAGKSALQNDKLVREGSRGDLWFHVRDYAGAHVLLDTGGNPNQVPEKAIRKAAQIAAYYSKARGADEAMVSYTQLKYVDKPKGAKPGLVRIEKEKTIVVDPSEV